MDRITTGLKNLSGRLLLRIVLIGVPLILATAGALALATFALDYTLKVPRAVRVVFLMVSVVGIGWVALRHLFRPLAKKPSLDELALMVERSDPSIKDQLISALQLERDLASGTAVESPEMIRALVAETSARFAGSSFRNAVDMKPTKRPLLLGGIAVAGVAGLAALFPAESGLWAKRQLLLQDTPWPRETTLVIEIPDLERFDPKTEGDRIILHVPERTPLQVQVRANGVLPDEVELVTAPLESVDREQPISMGRAQGNEFFQHIFPPLTRSIQFYARGGDDDDEVPIYEIRVARAPRVTRFWADYEYPKYTGQEDRSLPDVNLSAPDGTRINMHFEVNMALSAFDLEFQTAGSVAVQPDANGRYHHSFVIGGNDFYTYRLKGGNGVTSAEVPRYVITAESDQTPRVNVAMPTTLDVSLTTSATLPLMGVASDDYGVTSIGLRYGPARDDLSTGGRDFGGDELSGEGVGGRSVRFFVPLAVAELTASDPTKPEAPPRPIQEGDRLAVGFMVRDNRQTELNPEPQQVFSDFIFNVSVLSAEELKREISQLQYSLKNRVRRVTALAEQRAEETRSILGVVRAGPEGTPEEFQARLWRAEQDQNQITVELEAARRQFYRIYDGYLWNRLDPGSFNEKMISVLIGLFRKFEDGEREQIFGQAIQDVRPLIDENQALGRLTVILDILLVASVETSPKAHDHLTRVSLVTETSERTALLESALSAQTELAQKLRELSDKLQEWEDYLDLVQRVQELRESQEGIKNRIDNLRNK